MLASSERDLFSDSSDSEVQNPKDNGFASKFDPDFSQFTRKELKSYCQLKNYKIDSITNEVFNWVSHLITGLILTSFSLYFLIKSDSTVKNIAFIYYMVSNMIMLFGSALHHGIGLGGYSIGMYRFLRMVDHCGIFFVISGTFAPIALVCCGRVGFAVFFYLNIVMVISLTLKAITRHTLNQNVFNFVYLAMGWSSLLLIYFIYKSIGWMSCFELFLGGVSYSIGIVFFQRGRPNPIAGKFCSHEIWHCFVSAGVLFMVLPQFAVLNYAQLPEPSTGVLN